MSVGDSQNAFEIASSGSGLPGGSSGDSNPTPSAPVGSPTPEQLVEIKWNNKVEKLPLAQAIELAQKGYDYTQKMQALAKEREGFGSERTRYEEAIKEVRTFLQDPGRVEAYLQELRKQAGGNVGNYGQPAGQIDPEAVVTAEEMERQLKAAREEMRGATREEIAAMRQQIQVEQLAGQYSNDLGIYIESLKKQNPELRAIPRVEAILKEDVRKMKPQSIEEAKQMMAGVAKEHAKNVRNYLMEERKATGGGLGSSVLANGIEPRGGNSPLPVSNQQKFKSMTDPAFKAAVLQDIMNPGRS